MIAVQSISLTFMVVGGGGGVGLVVALKGASVGQDLRSEKKRRSELFILHTII